MAESIFARDMCTADLVLQVMQGNVSIESTVIFVESRHSIVPVMPMISDLIGTWA